MSFYQAAEKLFLHARLAKKAGRASGEGSRSEVRGCRNFEPRTSGRASPASKSAALRLTLVSRFTPHVSRFLFSILLYIRLPITQRNVELNQTIRPHSMLAQHRFVEDGVVL
jgi:hypothetical protein